MFRPATKKARRLRALLPIALACLLAVNGVLASFGAASGASIGRDQGSSFANVICAAVAAASDIGGDFGAPGKGHPHHAHHCIICCASGQAAASDPLSFPSPCFRRRDHPARQNPPPVRTRRRCSTPAL